MIKPLNELVDEPSKLDWLTRDDIKPYVYVRDDNKIKNPGSYFPLDWFSSG